MSLRSIYSKIQEQVNNILDTDQQQEKWKEHPFVHEQY